MLAIDVNVGDEVHVKDKLGTMEAMKMQQAIACPVDGKVAEICFNVGDRIDAGAVMFVIDE